MKSIQFLFLVSSFYNCYGFWGNNKPQYATELHQYAEWCDVGGPKGIFLDHLKWSKVDPATKDSHGKTAYEVAEEKWSQSRNQRCKYYMEQFELYEEWYREQNQKSDESS